MVCTDVEAEPVLQEVTKKTLNHGANKAPDARLNIHTPLMFEALGRDRDQHISMFGCVTPMQTLTET